MNNTMDGEEITRRMTPAEYVVHIFKGVRATARQIGCDPSLVSRWRTRTDRFGHVGTVPTAHRRAILAKAKELDLDITSEDLDFGRSIYEHGHE